MLVRRLAFLAAGLTLVLIVAGGLVTNTDSGLACPDWPMCFGSPLPKMAGGVAIEHSHRLIASAVGFLTALLTLLLLSRDGRRALGWLVTLGFTPLVLGGAFVAAAGVSKTGSMPPLPAALALVGFAGCVATWILSRGASRLAVTALILVLAQGLLGGMTVVYQLPEAVLVLHLGTSMLFFSTLLVLAFRVTESTAPGAPAAPPMDARAALSSEALAAVPAGTRALLWTTAAATYLQILLGATVRHTGSGLVCTDLPFCRGALWPANVHPAVHLHMAHRAFAFVVAALVIATAVKLWSSADLWSRALARVSAALVAVQIALGVLTIVTFKELFSVTGHLLVAALLLGTYVALLVRARQQTGDQAALAEGSVGSDARSDGRDGRDLAGAQL